MILEDKSDDYSYDPAHAYFGKYETGWFDDELLLELSADYPDTLFILECKTEDSDYFREYFKGGKNYCVDGKVVYPEFDESKLE